MKKIYLLLAFVICIGITQSKAQYTDLHNFNDTNGSTPYGNLTLIGNTLYGMTWYGGAHGDGDIFSIHTDGTSFRDLFDFNGANGANPYGSLTLLGGKFYGMASAGGIHNYGVVFSIDTNGSGYTILYNFNGFYAPAGQAPEGSLIVYGNKFFGMTYAGGNNGYGLIFSFDTNGAGYKVLFNFVGPNGRYPHGDLTPLGNKLFGMTERGGSHQDGNIFSIDTNGSGFRELLDFNVANGQSPYGDLLISGSKMYGMTYGGGASAIFGLAFSVDTNGTGFKDLLDFTDSANGNHPNGSFILLGNTLYGTTSLGGHKAAGLIFSIDTDGSAYKDLYDFDGTNGEYPENTLLYTGGAFYGTGKDGGPFSNGVVFKLDSNVTTSANNLSASRGSVNIYPNPNNGIFTVEMKNEKLKVKNIEVLNELGEKVYSQPVIRNSQFVINLGGQPDGVYLYRVLNEDGGLVGEGKLIIQK